MHGHRAWAEDQQETAQQNTDSKDKEKEEKIYIKSIVIKGFNASEKAQLKEIIAPYQDKYLTKSEIKEAAESVQKYCSTLEEKPLYVLYEVVNNKLILRIK